ncbi:serine O-acetyltransferase EpsC [Polynucleobacter asymbioticus]|uniref:serine O-acetyltransferase n=1 Tax=Polynucleobacter asymbioticus TaxID=576611 RepID=A0AAC9IXY3_9BURK|nr:serine O-acetyltransferase EpsC [Polynucleobacter asymbioticus]APB99366.1 serine acetyltransferase [Polynucleobacter asymbioticus]APC01673.1 serine acetyltransferase [Polynucleobacter asymbioticus]
MSTHHLIPSSFNLSQVVGELRRSREETHKIRHLGRVRELPSREALEEILADLFASLFPTHYGRADLTDESIDYFVGNVLSVALNKLSEQIRRGLYFSSNGNLEGEHRFDALAEKLTSQFAAQLPAIRALIVSDIRAAMSGDPAATSVSEILLCYPGVNAAIHYRIAHALYQLGAPLLARFISEIAHSRTGVDIHPGAQIGEGFFIDHGTGVVIGQTAILGKNIRLYQAVTLGAKRFPEDDEGNLIKGAERHPILEDDVVIYAGATVLGRITIGARSTIGGNVWLTKSVPPDSNISQAQTLGH